LDWGFDAGYRMPEVGWFIFGVMEYRSDGILIFDVGSWMLDSLKGKNIIAQGNALGKVRSEIWKP
jgi:hypothetical protein